ncbi:MAG: hypothetical protein EZS28_006642 [Streblomastix strix]|uniref:Uncharacterized protein n=1 Tax=Streblomastix strix TaxID=222440 RepID=A0A5J4WSB9_9EUKA|nr:MAG: hypothetical protein EZS28_006642 [Streblomastix strix]
MGLSKELSNIELRNRAGIEIYLLQVFLDRGKSVQRYGTQCKQKLSWPVKINVPPLVAEFEVAKEELKVEVLETVGVFDFKFEYDSEFGVANELEFANGFAIAV